MRLDSKLESTGYGVIYPIYILSQNAYNRVHHFIRNNQRQGGRSPPTTHGAVDQDKI